MSGYLGNPDAEAEHAIILAENGINASRLMLEGPIRERCLECNCIIDQRRRIAAVHNKMKCIYCIHCQNMHDKHPKIQMLTKML